MAGTNTQTEQAYLDEYFAARRAKEIRRLIIAVVAMVVGVPIAGFAAPIAAYLEVTETLVSMFGMGFNLCGFAILTMWIMDGKDYVFPPKRPHHH